MHQPGRQYLKDDLNDHTGFLRKARLHQSVFRAEKLELPYDGYGNYLTEEVGRRGMNFYKGFGIFEAVTKYRKYNKALYSNMLRSEHIPFNFFIPLKSDSDYAVNVFREILKKDIASIDCIKIEYAPERKNEYLNDSTSFDAFVTYTNSKGFKGYIGIEVKYTEQAYKLKKSSKEEGAVNDDTTLYYIVTRKSGIYKEDAIGRLKIDRFRQIWRNHMLGESMRQHQNNTFKYFTSLTLFPAGNLHFVETSKEYLTLLKEDHVNFVPFTYEDFFMILEKYCPDEKYQDWINYLTERYLVKI